jgi:hypothetical protein
MTLLDNIVAEGDLDRNAVAVLAAKALRQAAELL